MTLAVIDILESIQGQLLFQGARDTWEADIEAFAPGYLALESASNGLVNNYDPRNFKNEAELLV